MQKEEKNLDQKDFLADKTDATNGVDDITVSGRLLSKKTKNPNHL